MNFQKFTVEEIKGENKTAMFLLKQSVFATKTFILFIMYLNAAGFAKEKYPYCKTSSRGINPLISYYFIIKISALVRHDSGFGSD